MEGIINTTTAAAGATTAIAYWLRSSASWANATREAPTGGAHALSLSPLSAAASAAVDSGSGNGNMSAAPDSELSAAYEGPLRTTFLGLFTFVAFAGNLLLMLAVAQSRTLRRTGLNVHLIGMAAANCLFCAVDMPLMIASSVAAEWQYGAMACSIFAYLHITSSVEYVLGIVCLAVDRLAVAKLSRSRSRSGTSASDFAPAAALTVSCWLMALSVGVPLLTSTVPVAWYPHRYMCDIGVGSDPALAYGAAVYACLFALPSLLVVLLLTLTASATLRDRDESPRRRDRHTRTGGEDNGRHDSEGDGLPPASGASWRSDPGGARGAVFVLLVFVLWILLKVPLVALASTEVYLHSMTTVGLPAHSEHVLSIVFAWLACAHCTVLPFAAFVWCRDIWVNFKDVLAWRKSAAAVGVARSGGSALAAGSQRVGSVAHPVASVERFPARFKVPVLIATETGLHVHDDDNNNAAHAAPEAAGVAGGDQAAEASDERDGRENRFIYADLTTRSYEITIERPAARSGTLASGSDLTDDADDVADLSPYSDHPGALRALATHGIRTIAGGTGGEGAGGVGGAGAQNLLLDGGVTSAAPGQTNSLSTDSGVGSAAGSVSRENRKSKGRVRTRGPLLVRTGSQPPPETDEKGGGGANGGEPLPRIPLTLGAGWASWLPPEHVDYKSVPMGYQQSGVGGEDVSYHGYRTIGLAEAVAVTETDAERQSRLKLSSGWAASETPPQPLAPATTSRKRKRKKKQSKQASVASESAFAAMPTYNDCSDSTSQPLRPVRLAPLALSSAPIATPAPAAAPAAAYGPLLTGPGRRVANSSETPF